MFLERQATAPRERSAIVKDLLLFFRRQGYKSVGSGRDLVFRRGSVFGNLFGMSPRGWQVKVTVQLEPHEIGARAVAEWMVDTSGQIVTATEESFWKTETEDFVEAVHGRLDLANESNALAEEAEGFATRVVTLMVLIPLGLLALVVALIAITGGFSK